MTEILKTSPIRVCEKFETDAIILTLPKGENSPPHKYLMFENDFIGKVNEYHIAVRLQGETRMETIGYIPIGELLELCKRIIELWGKIEKPDA